MDNAKYEVLKLENQFCFPLYACSREIVKRYKPFLDQVDLTYTLKMLKEKGIITKKHSKY